MCILKNVSFLFSLAYTGVCTFYDDPYLAKTQTNYIRAQAQQGQVIVFVCCCLSCIYMYIYIFLVLTMIRSQDLDA